ncbi:MAG: hypothetical protein ACRDPW_00740 [Mycobacteriales bacterium]
MESPASQVAETDELDRGYAELAASPDQEQQRESRAMRDRYVERVNAWHAEPGGHVVSTS